MLRYGVGEGFGIKTVRERRVERVKIQLSKREKEKLEELARKSGVSVSAYIRQICIYEKWSNLFEVDEE